MKAVFAGTFDPFTEGHYEIVNAARGIFTDITVAVADGCAKSAAPIETRCTLAKLSLGAMQGVRVEAFSGLLTDFMQKNSCIYMIRGLRDVQDFLYEQNLAAVYASQNPEIKQIYFISAHKYKHVSSTIVRELAALGGNLNGYAAAAAQTLIKKTYA
ncbi:MAG: pantetheine-phosphate adenylyltransferase [Firmicutes bacterium]|nr:pantetheine-phosphate adenylyltransferase [Bacillota bacterium]